MTDHIIFGVHIHDRLNHAVEVQRVLTAFGGQVKTRLGLHEPAPTGVGGNGLLLLEVVGDPAKIRDFEAQLRQVEGVGFEKMVFSHA